MITIRFEARLRHEVNQAETAWLQEQREKQPGVIFTMSILGPPTGSKLNLMVEPEFVDYLRTTDIPFEVV